MAMVNFKKGLLSKLPATYSEGTFYVTTDERAIYLDVSDNARIRLGDFQEFATVAALTANPNPNLTALYYVTDINCLAKWDGSEYVQINRDTGMTSVEVTGDGNAITAAVYSADGRKLTLTKGATYMTAADVDTKISNKVGEIEGTVKKYVDDYKTSNDKALADVKATAEQGVTDAAAVASDLNEHITEADAKYETKTNVTTKINAVQTSIDELDTYVGTIPEGYVESDVVAYINKKAQETLDAAQGGGSDTVASVKEALDAYKAENDPKVKANADAIDVIEADYLKAADKTELSNAIATETERAIGIETGLRTDVDAIKNDYLKKADKTELQDNIDAVDALVDTLIGTDTGKSARTIANEELAKQLIPENAQESLDTLEEIAAWIQAHPDDAAAMNAAITALQNKVGDIPEGATATTIVAYIQEVVNAEKARAEGAEADLDSRLDAVEAKFGDGEGNVESQIAAAKAEAIATAADDATTKANTAKTDAIASAKAYTDTEVGKDRTRLDALEADTHAHANKSELDKIEIGDKAKWDAAQANAEATAASALAAAKTELEGKISDEATTARAAEKANADAIAIINGTGTGSIAKALVDAKAYTDELANGAVATNTEDIANLNAQLQWGSF